MSVSWARALSSFVFLFTLFLFQSEHCFRAGARGVQRRDASFFFVSEQTTGFEQFLPDAHHCEMSFSRP